VVHRWYSLGRHVAIGTLMVIFAFLSSHVYQDCTNSAPIVKNSQQQSKDSQNSKNDHWCTNRHMSPQSPPNTQSPRPRLRPPNTQSPNVTVSARNLHFSAPLSHLTPPMGWIPLSYLIQIWHRKTRVHGLQSGAGYIMLALAILIQYVNVTDTQTHSQTRYDRL